MGKDFEQERLYRNVKRQESKGKRLSRKQKRQYSKQKRQDSSR